MLISALESAFNYKSEARYATGFMQSARYRQFMSTPTHHVFAYADSSPDQVCCATGFWFAKELKDKTLLWETRRMVENSASSFTGEDRFLPMMLVWASKSEISGAYVPSDNFYVSRGEQPVFVYREGWSSKNDTYLGIKGGYARFSHAHMDSGSFVFERECSISSQTGYSRVPKNQSTNPLFQWPRARFPPVYSFRRKMCNGYENSKAFISLPFSY